jgi:methylated-DNA-[protein]-cysteine S-methyltransferase
MDLYLKHLASPIGELHVYATDRSVVGLFMGSRPFKGCRRPWQEAREADHALLLETAGELDAYFAGRLRSFTVPVEVAGTDFQKAVWESLRTIAYGELRTYGDVARAIGRPAAVRAVGGAIGSNPVSIIIPCHRVIGSDDSLTGFGGGLPVKQRLLEMEGHAIAHLKLEPKR